MLLLGKQLKLCHQCLCWLVQLRCSIAKQSGTYKALQRPAGQEENRMCRAVAAYKVIWKTETRREGSWIWVALDCQAPSMCSLKVGAAPGPKPAGICRVRCQARMCSAVMVHQLSGVKFDMNIATQLRMVHLQLVFCPMPMLHP